MKHHVHASVLVAAVTFATAVRPLPAQRAAHGPPAAARGVTKTMFGTLEDGTPIDIYTLRNSHGLTARVIAYGAIIQSLDVPDRNGKLADIVLGFDSLRPYETQSPYFGAVVGRHANRIARGRFTLDGKTYQLLINNGPNSLHGGTPGFDKAVWKAQPFEHHDGVSLVLTHVSPNGDQGYPGTLHVEVATR